MTRFRSSQAQGLAFFPPQVYGDKDADGFYRGETCARLGLIPCNMVSEIQADDDEMMDQLLRQGFLPLNTPVEKTGNNTPAVPGLGQQAAAPGGRRPHRTKPRHPRAPEGSASPVPTSLGRSALCGAGGTACARGPGARTSAQTRTGQRRPAGWGLRAVRRTGKETAAFWFFAGNGHIPHILTLKSCPTRGWRCQVGPLAGGGGPEEGPAEPRPLLSCRDTV